MTPRELFDSVAVESHPVSVPRLHMNFMLVASGNSRLIIKTMAGVKPAVETASEGVVHPVGISFVPHRSVESRFSIRSIIAIRILQQPDVRNAVDDATIQRRVNSNRDVQPLGEHGGFVVTTIPVSILQDFDRIPRDGAFGGRKRVFRRVSHPQSPSVIEVEIQWLEDIRLCRDQFHFESFGNLERFQLLLRSQRIRGTDAFGKWRLRDRNSGEQNPQCPC